MDHYLNLRSQILDLNQEVSALLEQSDVVLGHSTSSFEQWKQTCSTIAKNLQDHVVRVAVVGAIKSGKSTFVNALLGKDHLKRGAGVVTSIVTRIRKGALLNARLFFKSWDDINAEIEQALVLFPADQWQPQHSYFDIRRKQDREDLASALDGLDKDLRVAQDQLNANVVLLTSYLKGFEIIQPYVGAENTTREFDAEQFADHRQFVGNDALAVYLKDIELEVSGDQLSGNIEIADCQGSDSPNPLHMAMIQDYLLKAHMIVYVISSRTGLRQADIRFLSMIKKMGIAGNMMFVCNCDLNEHADLADLQALVRRMREELALLVETPELFSISALLNLFAANEDALTERDAQRLSQWQACGDLVDFSNDETRRMEKLLNRKLSRERSSLLLHNQLERFDVMTAGLHRWIRLNRDLIHRDAGEAKTMAIRIEDHQKHIVQVQGMIHSTLEGAVQKIKASLRKKVDSFFDLHSGPVLKQVLHYVRNYEVDLSSYEETSASGAFTQSLYLVFQSFRQAVDTYMAEKINPEIIGFVGREEKELTNYFQEVAEPYKTMVGNTLAQFEETLSQFGLDSASEKWTLDLSPDLEGIKQSMNITLPPAAATMRYSAQIKTDAIVRLGVYSVLRFVRKAFKKPVGSQNEEGIRALRDGVRRMKKETERSVQAHFIDYRENIKFQYMMRLADIAGVRLYENLTEHFHAYLSDLKTLMASIGNERTDKEKIEDGLGTVEQTITNIKSRIHYLREEIIRLQDDDDAMVLRSARALD